MEADELRGAAAFLVLIYHSVHFGLAAIGNQDWPRTANPFLALIYEGHTGVSLFIVLSGFILATGSFGEHLSYKGFIRNRALRILPLAALIYVFSIYASNELSLDRLIVPLMPLVSKSYGVLDPAQLSGTIWTAFVEFQIYLVAPFLFLFTARRGLLRFLIPLGTAIFIFKAMEIGSTDKQEAFRISYFTILGRFNQFLAGVALAYILDKGKVPKNFRAGTVPVALLGLFGGAILMLATVVSMLGGLKALGRWNVFYQDIEAILWVGFIGSYLLCRPLRENRISKLLSKFALISFSVYVLHYAVLVMFWYRVFPHIKDHVPSTSPTVFLLSLLLVFPIAALAKLSFIAIEEPFLKLRVRYVQNEAQPTA